MEHLNTLIKKIGKEVQYSVVLTDIILTTYVLWLIVTNTSHWLPGVLFSWTPAGAWLLLRANRLFNFCILHKLMIFHSFAVYCCCVFQSQFGFGIMLYPMRWLMLILGLGLIIQLIIQQLWIKNGILAILKKKLYKILEK